MPTVVIVERVPGRADAILAGIGDGAVTCVAEDAVEALRLAVELRPDAVVVGTDTGDMPPTSLLRRLAADERLVGVRRVALAGEREADHSPEELIAAGAQLVLPPRPPRSSAAACGRPPRSHEPELATRR